MPGVPLRGIEVFLARVGLSAIRSGGFRFQSSIERLAQSHPDEFGPLLRPGRSHPF